MAKVKQDQSSDEVTVVGQDVKHDENKEFIVPANAVIDVEVIVISQESDPYHETGAEFGMGKKRAEQLQEKGWVKIKETKK